MNISPVTSLSWHDHLTNICKRPASEADREIVNNALQIDFDHKVKENQNKTIACLFRLLCCCSKREQKYKVQQRYYERLQSNLVAFGIFRQQVITPIADVTRTYIESTNIQQNYPDLAPQVMAKWAELNVPVKSDELESLQMGSACSFGICEDFLVQYLTLLREGMAVLEAVGKVSSCYKEGATPLAEIYEISYRASLKDISPKVKESWDGWINIEKEKKAQIEQRSFATEDEKEQARKKVYCDLLASRIDLTSMHSLIGAAIPLHRGNLVIKQCQPYAALGLTVDRESEINRLKGFLQGQIAGCYLITIIVTEVTFHMVYIKQDHGDHYMMDPGLATVRTTAEECEETLFKLFAIYFSRSAGVYNIAVFSRVELKSATAPAEEERKENESTVIVHIEEDEPFVVIDPSEGNK